MPAPVRKNLRLTSRTLIACAVVAVICIAVGAAFGFGGTVGRYAGYVLAAAVGLPILILNYHIFSGTGQPTIYRPGDERQNDRR